MATTTIPSCVKAIGDRFAEALAEYTHQKVRKEHWGYAADEALSNMTIKKNIVASSCLRLSRHPGPY